MELFKNELRQPVEGKNIQTRVAGNSGVAQQLALELEGGLFGCEQNQRIAIRRLRERGAYFSKAAEGLAAAGGAEEEARLHDLFLRKGAWAQRILL